MKKRGQGLSLNLIVAAIIAVLVLVVISFIFTSRFTSTAEGLDACNSGSCETKDSCVNRGGIPYSQKTTCSEKNPDHICCIAG